jgi:hypothetical protein
MVSFVFFFYYGRDSDNLLAISLTENLCSSIIFDILHGSSRGTTDAGSPCQLTATLLSSCFII